MPLLRRKARDEEIPKAGPYAPGWDVPARFNFTRDVIEAIATDPLKPAMTFVDREGIVDRRTFHEIAGDAARWAHLMRTRLDRGDRVVLAIGNVPSWQAAMLGAIKSGLVAVPCPQILRARDLAFRVGDSGARLVVADRSLELEIEEMRHQVGASVSVLFLDEALDELRRYMPLAPTEDTTAGETAVILYTSGTDREPKGVVHTHAYTWAQRAQATHWLDAHEGDVVWCTSETGWAKGIWNSLLGPWSHGAEIVVHDGAFDAQERLSLLQRLGVTILAQTPTEYRMLAKLEKLEFTHLPRLRHAVSVGEPLNPEVIARFQDALGLTVHDGYGQTENSLLIANTPGVPIRPGSMGLPTPGHDVAVIDEVGQVCPPGVEGDLALIGRPPTLFAGYWGAPDETAAVFRDDWYLTGDRATRDADGYFWFVGRADDVIVSAAYRISPFEVESALLEHPAVAESAVVGVPDLDRGQIVKAFVVLRPGQEPTDRLATELQEHVKAVTAPYNCPREVTFVAELPKTTSGKIQRSELRRLHAELAAAPPPALTVLPDPDEPDPTAAEAAERERREAELAVRRDAVERTRLAAAAAAERAALQSQGRVRVVPDAPGQAEEESEEIAAAAAAAAAEQARVEAEERARVESEAAAERARVEAEERARAEAEEAARLAAEAEAEAAERARVEAERNAPAPKQRNAPAPKPRRRHASPPRKRRGSRQRRPSGHVSKPRTAPGRRRRKRRGSTQRQRSAPAPKPTRHAGQPRPRNARAPRQKPRRQRDARPRSVPGPRRKPPNAPARKPRRKQHVSQPRQRLPNAHGPRPKLPNAHARKPRRKQHVSQPRQRLPNAHGPRQRLPNDHAPKPKPKPPSANGSRPRGPRLRPRNAHGPKPRPKRPRASQPRQRQRSAPGSKPRSARAPRQRTPRDARPKRQPGASRKRRRRPLWPRRPSRPRSSSSARRLRSSRRSHAATPVGAVARRRKRRSAVPRRSGSRRRRRRSSASATKRPRRRTRSVARSRPRRPPSARQRRPSSAQPRRRRPPSVARSRREKPPSARPRTPSVARRRRRKPPSGGPRRRASRRSSTRSSGSARRLRRGRPRRPRRSSARRTSAGDRPRKSCARRRSAAGSTPRRRPSGAAVSFGASSRNSTTSTTTRTTTLPSRRSRTSSSG